jgi:hypothetical protein
LTAPPGLQTTISWDVMVEELVVVVSSYLLQPVLPSIEN